MAELSAYEAKRRRRMEENRAALLALQIERLPAPKRPRRDASSKDAQPKERRRSVRLQELETVTAKQRERARQLERRERLDRYFSTAEVTLKGYRVLPATPLDLPVLDLSGCTAVGPRVSTMELAISVERFHTQWLGKQIVPLGKHPVMQGMVDAGVEAEEAPVAVFGKMSGVQQFRNALALFVNADQSTSYDNVFQEVGKDGKRVVFFRWFAQKYWSYEARAVQRLLRVRRGDARFFLEQEANNVGGGTKEEQDDQKDEPLLLFLRQTLGPYIYCGRLGFLGVRSAVKPLEFRWQLLDADALSWKNIRRQVIDSY